MDDLLDLCRDLPTRDLAAGEELLAEGSRTGLIFVLADGVLAIESGGLLLKRVADRGACLGELSALLGTTHSARVVALEPSRVHVMPAADLSANPAVLLGVARLLAARLHGMTGYLFDLRRQYGDEATHLGLMAEVLSELTSVRPSGVGPGSERPDVPDY